MFVASECKFIAACTMCSKSYQVLSPQLDSIRTRRARLQALTASIRLPPLTPVDVLGTHPASVYNNTSHRSLPSGERHLRLQQKANLPTSATSVRAQSGSTKLPALSLPPMTLVLLLLHMAVFLLALVVMLCLNDSECMYHVSVLVPDPATFYNSQPSTVLTL